MSLIADGFDGRIRIHDNNGDLLDDKSTTDGQLGLLSIDSIQSGEDYFIQIIANSYIDMENFSLSVGEEANAQLLAIPALLQWIVQRYFR